MSTVSLFAGNPNPKVATFEIKEDLLGSFSKLVVTRTGKLTQYCPLAENLFSSNGGLVRIDIATREGKTYITLARKIGDWSDNMVADSQSKIINFLSKSIPAVYIDAIAQNVTAQEPFAPKNPVHKLVQEAFNDQVNPLLADHGGAMELMNIVVKPTGEITVDVALIGSCNGCGDAEKNTLNGAEEKIREVLDEAKKKYETNPDVQKLNLNGITVREIPELIFTK